MTGAEHMPMEVWSKSSGINDMNSNLSAQQVWYTLNSRRKGTKVILQNVSVDIPSGKVLAIMGPSGAGKTMFLNCLTLQRGPGVRYGAVTLNGQVFTNNVFEKYCSIVTQMDIHWTFLTCRQSLMLAAELFNPDGHQERLKEVETMCEKSGMRDCMDTRIGNAFIPGLAFGQRRRLSLMLSLLKHPLVVFLDEPTTNLDSASAAGIMRHLKVVAQELNIIIVCTIHQPDRHVFAGFDALLLLSEGKVAYNGSAKKAQEYFCILGKEVPPGVNPADFLLDLMNKSFTDPEIVDELLDAWAKGNKENVKPLGLGQTSSKFPPAPTRRNVLMQIGILFKRHCLLFIRDPSLYLGRVIMITGSTCFFALCYVKSRNRVQEQALNRIWLMLWCIGVPGNLSVVASFALNLEFLNVRFEVLGGMYKLICYIIAHTMVQLPVMFLNAVCAVTIAGYIIGSWNLEKFLPMICVFALCFWSFECVAQACSVGKANPLLGMMDFMNYWFCSFLFCGFMLRIEDVFWPFRLFVYILPMKYTIQACAYLEVEGSKYDGAEEDDSPVGYSCPGNFYGVGCFGRTGVQVLDSLHQNFAVITSDLDPAVNLLIVFIICLAFKLIFVAFAYYRCRSVAPPTPIPDGVKADLAKLIESNNVAREKPDSTSQPELKNENSKSVRGTAVIFEKAAVGSRACFSVEKAWQLAKAKPWPPTNKEKKTLLQNVSFSVRSGEILSVMGPSGGGKSLIMKLASLVKGAKERYGEVKLNGVPFSAQMYSNYASEIQQTDTHWPFLTPREELQMALDLFSRKSRAEKTAMVDDILFKMGLEGCQHTRIGNQFIPGCSGGQRRRASIALALAKNSLILFLDEPTAGLDAAAAWSIIGSIKEHAIKNDIAVLCTLSQPSVEIFDLLDQLVLLSEGSVAYSGDAKQAVPYFESIGYSLSTGDNPAEFLVGLLNRGFAESEVVDSVLGNWPKHENELMTKLDPSMNTRPLPDVATGPNSIMRLGFLLKRHLLLVVRDPTMYSGRLIMGTFCNAFFGLMYIESRDAVQVQVLNRIFFLMWCCGVPSNLILIAVFAHQTETSQVNTETRSGMYAVGEYIVAQFLLQIFLLPFVVLGGIAAGFLIGNWAADNFVEYWILYFLGYAVFEAVAQCLAVRPMHMLLNMMDFANFWFISFLFCGVILPQEDVVWPLRLFTYILPFRYWLRENIWLVITPQDYKGAVHDSSSPNGFVCNGPGVTIANCFGPQGCEVLNTAKRLFDAMSCDDKRSNDYLYLLIMIVVWKLLFALGLIGRCKGLAPLRRGEGLVAKVFPITNTPKDRLDRLDVPEDAKSEPKVEIEQAAKDVQESDWLKTMPIPGEYIQREVEAG